MLIYALQSFTATDGTVCTAKSTFTVTDSAGHIAIQRGQASPSDSPDAVYPAPANFNAGRAGLVDPVNGVTHSTSGTAILTVGAKGRFATLQAAINYALTLPQWSETSVAGTITLTKDSVAVTGTSTAFTSSLIANTHISSAATASRKFYPIEQSIQDDTHISLALPFQDTTATGVAYVVARPLFTKIMLLDVNEELVFINSTGASGGSAVHANLIFDFNNQDFRGDISHNLIDGAIQGRNWYSSEATGTNKGTITGISQTIADFYFDNIVRRSKNATDWFVPNGYVGRSTLRNSDIVGNFDLWMPELLGRGNLDNTRLTSIKNQQTSSSSSAQALSALFGKDGAIFHANGCTFETDAVGLSDTNCITVGGYDNDNARRTTGNIAIFDDCSFMLKKIPGGTESANVHFINVDVDNSDLYFNNCKFYIDGTLTPASTWRFIAHVAGVGVANRVYIDGGRLPDLTSVTTKAVITKLGGNRGVKAITSTTNAYSTNDLSALKATTFTSTLTENVTSIASVANAPDGTEVTFIFTQNGTGGFTVGWAANYIFGTAWSNTGNTANKVSAVTFKKSGSNWYQTSAANSWL